MLIINCQQGYQHDIITLLANSAPYWNDKCELKVYSNKEFVNRFLE